MRITILGILLAALALPLACGRAQETAKDKAECTSGYEISSALVSLSGQQINSMNSKGMAGVSGRTIGFDDVALPFVDELNNFFSCEDITFLSGSY